MRFLSPEWLAGLGASTSAGAAADICVAVHQRVTGGPGGDVEYTLRVDHGKVTVEPGPPAAAFDVEIVEDYQTAVAISQGALTPAGAFAAGRLRLIGSVDVLVATQEALAALAPWLADLAGDTSY